MSTGSAEIARLQLEVGALVERHRSRGGLTDYAKYATDPAGFIRDVLHGKLWDGQRRIAEATAAAPRVVVRSSNGFGKDWLAARLALWWVYARGGFVLMTGPTERQVKHIVMGEIHRAFAAAKDLPGELFEMALRLPDRSSHAGILAFTSKDVSSLTGFHAPKLLIGITEAQGVEEVLWEAMFACAVGAADTILAVGNPLVAGGRFFEASRSERWASIRLSAFDHPNVMEDREVIPGAVTREFIATIAAEYGEGSGIYRARILGEFPDETDDALCRRSWVESANRKWAQPLAEGSTAAPVILALDPARFGADQTALAVREGMRIRELITWSQKDLMTSCGRVITEMDRLNLNVARVPIVVDEVGLGVGIGDRLKELGCKVVFFNGGRTPNEPARFVRARCEAAWRIRRLLEDGQLALPPDDKLTDELCAIRWRPNSSGKVELEPKDETRKRLGRSPDRFDALCMAFWPKSWTVVAPPVDELRSDAWTNFDGIEGRPMPFRSI